MELRKVGTNQYLQSVNVVLHNTGDLFMYSKFFIVYVFTSKLWMDQYPKIFGCVAMLRTRVELMCRVLYWQMYIWNGILVDTV